MKHERFLKITIITALIALLTAVLCGCSLIGGLLGSKTSFELLESEITLKIGDNYEVELKNGNKEEFKLSSSDETKVEVFGKTGIKAVGKTTTPVTVTATNNNGDTAKLKVTVNYADVKRVSIIADNQYQLLKKGESPNLVTFTAKLNDGADPNTQVKWTFTDADENVIRETAGNPVVFTPEKDKRYFVTAEAGGETASTDVIACEGMIAYLDKYQIGTKEKIRVHALYFDTSYVGKKVGVYISDSSDNLIYAEELKPTRENDLGIVNALLNKTFETGEYTLKITAGSDTKILAFTVKDYISANHINVEVNGTLDQTNPSAVKFTATLSPENADVSSVKWYVNGEYKSKGKTFVVTPSQKGEYHVTAEINKITKTRTIVYLPAGDEAREYAEHFHDYGGYSQNRYITSKEELKNLILHVLENQIKGQIKFYAGYSTVDKVKSDIEEVERQVEESGYTRKKTPYSNGNVITIEFLFYIGDIITEPIVNSPTMDAPDIVQNTKQNTYSEPHYNSTPKSRNFYIDTVSDEMEVRTSNMLYKAVSWGYKPKFVGEHASELQQIYKNAKDALSCIVSDEMTEYEKVHAIYDYIIYNVRYDHDCASADEGIDINVKMTYYGYYLEGIFLDEFYNKDMHAVCDGKSKAFVLMCGIEGITSVRITGEASSDGVNFSGHAWNKVLLDLQGNGEKEWYFVDTTWGDVRFGDGTDEYLSHAYFLLNDAQTSATHREKENHGYPKAEGNFDYYAYETFKYGTTEYNYKLINKATASNQIANALKAHPTQQVFEFEFAFSVDQATAGDYASKAMEKAKRYGRYSTALIRSNVLIIMFEPALQVA